MSELFPKLEDPFEDDDTLSAGSAEAMRQEIGELLIREEAQRAIGSVVVEQVIAKPEVDSLANDKHEQAKQGKIDAIEHEESFIELLSRYSMEALGDEEISRLHETGTAQALEDELTSLLEDRLDLLREFNTNKTPYGRRKLGSAYAPSIVRQEDILPCDHKSQFENWSGDGQPRKNTNLGPMPSNDWIVHLAKEKLMGRFDENKKDHPVYATVVEGDSYYKPALQVNGGFHRVASDLLLGRTPQNIEFI